MVRLIIHFGLTLIAMLICGRTNSTSVTDNPVLLGVTMVRPDPTYKCDPKNNGAFQHVEKCEYFYDCYNGIAWLGLCTEKMLFDIKYNGCNYPHLVDCGDRKRPAGVPPYQPTDPDDFECPSPFGYFADPKNCAKFYVCDSGRAIRMDCQKGLYYDPVLGRCEWPSNVNCGTRPILPEQ